MLRAWAGVAQPLEHVVMAGAALACARTSRAGDVALGLVSDEGVLRLRFPIASCDTFSALIRCAGQPGETDLGGDARVGVAINGHCGTGGLDLVVRLDGDDAPAITLAYDASVFEELWARDFAQLLIALTTQGAETPDRALAHLRSRDPALALGPPRARPRACVTEGFLARVASEPNAVAAIDARSELTYHDLRALAGGVAQELWSLGIGRGHRVGVCVEASTHLPVALLGTLLAGAAFVPLDPAGPPERIAHVLRDSGARAVITASATRDHFPADVRRLRIDRTSFTALLPAPFDLDALAYVVYPPSGTTGVAVDHASFAAVVRESAALLDVHPGMRVLQHAGTGSGLAALEVFLALVTGATLVHAGHDDELEDVIVDRGAEVWVGTPAGLAQIDPERVPTLTRLAVGGQGLPPRLAQRWAPGRRCFTVYGPAEGAALTTAHRCTGAERTSPPVGQPLPGRQAIIVNDALHPVAPGEIGEICIGGLGLASAYWENEALTAERFVRLPTPAPCARFYRTGDFGFMTSDGTLHLVPRLR
ncbi:MAG TPA: AMP-binding protein [Solirubrobacteraceae bacterium]